MRDKIVFNFWKILLLLICIRLLYVLIYVIIGLLYSKTYQTDSIQTILEYVSILLFIPFLIWSSKQSDTNFKDMMLMPDLLTGIKMLAIIVLAQGIVLSPFSHFEIFLDSLKHSRLRIIGPELRQLVPLLDLRLILIVPIIEEFFFRGLILENFLKRYKPVYAIILSSLLFGLNHLSLNTLGIHFLLGILLGVLFYSTRSLIVVIFAHIIWNSFTIIKFQFIELNQISQIISLLLYATACIALVYLLMKSCQQDKWNLQKRP